MWERGKRDRTLRGRLRTALSHREKGTMSEKTGRIKWKKSLQKENKKGLIEDEKG